MSVNNINSGSAKYAPGRTNKRHMRIEKAVRLEATGLYSNADIARHMGIHVQTLVMLKQTPEYKAKFIEVSTGVISQYDLDLRKTHENQREELADMVPMALMQLRKFALSANPSIALKANLEILDRDGNHSKVSRTSVTLEPTVDLAGVNAIGNNILNVLKGIGQDPSAARVSGAVAGAEGSVADGFTVSAKVANSQVNIMAETITEKTLEEIDLSKATKQ
jgi:hypothetical protein